MTMYAGITIGPIFDTISEASFPAALWFGSTLFSDLTRRLCVAVLDYGGELISPAFDEADREGLSGGIGKYHDHIIFKKDTDAVALKTWLEDTVRKAKEDTLTSFAFEKMNPEKLKNYRDFLLQYLQISYCVLTEEELAGQNCILALSPYLDALECMKTFPKEDVFNPIREIMKKTSANAADDRSSSEYIKKSPLFPKNVADSQLLRSGKQDIWSIEELAAGHVAGAEAADKGLKYKKYFAVVTADADGMGEFLKKLDAEKTKAFSSCCLAYSKAAAEKIKEFGGMTIYAGGDDLLFLAPVMVKKEDCKTVLALCSELTELFRTSLEETPGEAAAGFWGAPIPTMSFGIAIHYCRFPLYEALADSRGQLEYVKEHVDGKNSICINLQKHSGQQAGVVIRNDKIMDADAFLMKLHRKLYPAGDGKKNAEAMQGVIVGIGSKLEQQYHILNTMDELGLENPVWDNLFDNEGQAAAADYLKEIHCFYYETIRPSGGAFHSMMDEQSKERYNYRNEQLNTLLALVRMGKFFVEKEESR